MLPRVLIIEDDVAKRYVISRHLRLSGFETIEASAGAEGLQLVRSLPDLVILDVKLPDIHGFEVCKQIKQDPETRSVLVLELSARYVSTADRVHGLESGADGYLTHPVDLGELVANIHSLLRLRNAERLNTRMAIEVEASERKYRAVTDTVSVGLIQIDAKDRCTFANPAAVAITGYSLGELVGKKLHAYLHGADEPCPADCPLRTLSSCGSEVRDLREQLRRKDGAWVPVRVSANPMWDRDELLGAVIEFRDDRALCRAERARDLFLATLGHDLRNPLNTVVLGCNLLGTADLEPNQRTTLKRMMNGAVRMERLIQQTLFLAQTLVESVPLDRTTTDLGVVCDTLIDEVRQSHSGCSVSRFGVEHSIGIWDAGRLNQVVDNLLTNAIRHGDGAVSLTLQDDAETAILTMHNRGQPIAPDAIESLFDPFRRAGGRSGGVGLGLYIVDQIIRAHGGQIEVHSNEAEGTTFRVRLPKLPPSN
jgi:phosphoserine phosphatase RsbU/P